MIFVCTFAIMLVSFIYAVLVLEDVLETCVKKFDSFSFLLSALAFGGITLGVGNIDHGIMAPSASAPLIVGVVSGCLFVYRQLHMDQPFLELRVFKHINFSLSVLSSMLLYLAMMAASILMPLYVQNIMGYSATVSGLVTLPGSLAMAIVSPLAGKIYDKIGMRNLAITGSVALFVGIGGMCFVTLQTPLINSLRTIAGAIGTAVFVEVMNFTASASADSYGALADIHGMHVSFAAMSAVAAIMLVVMVLCVKSAPKKMPERKEKMA